MPVPGRTLAVVCLLGALGARGEAPVPGEALRRLKAEPWPQRLASAAGQFLGAPYLLSPLGEGEGRDPDPLLRFDAFDCLTLVEESMALGLAPDEGAFLPTLSAIRYQGAPAWGHRLHVMESQWLPHQLQAGRLKDVTRDHGGTRTRRVAKVIDRRAWEAPLGRSLHLEAAEQTVGRYELDLIPAAHAARALAGAPSGLVVVVVRRDDPALVTRITHTGVLVHTPAGPVLRHASSIAHRVVDEPLATFLQGAVKRGTEGVAVFEPREPAGGQ